MGPIRWLAPAFLLLAGTATAQDVRYNYDKSADFTKYKTYKWVDMKTSDKDEMTDKEIRSTIDAELATKGLSQSESDNVDLYVGYQVAIATEKQVNTFSSDFGYGPGWGYYGGYGGVGTGHEHGHEHGHNRHALYRRAAARFLRGPQEASGLSCRHYQDPRYQGKTRKTSEEPGEGRKEDAQELPTHT